MSRQVFSSDRVEKEFNNGLQKIYNQFNQQLRDTKNGDVCWALDALDQVKKLPESLARAVEKHIDTE
jgi:hypothetical protein